MQLKGLPEKMWPVDRNKTKNTLTAVFWCGLWSSLLKKRRKKRHLN